MEYIKGCHLDDLDYMRDHEIDPKQVAKKLNGIVLEMLFNHGYCFCAIHYRLQLT